MAGPTVHSRDRMNSRKTSQEANAHAFSSALEFRTHTALQYLYIGSSLIRFSYLNESWFEFPASQEEETPSRPTVLTSCRYRIGNVGKMIKHLDSTPLHSKFDKQTNVSLITFTLVLVVSGFARFDFRA